MSTERPVSDAEIGMHALRLMRSGNYQKAAPLMKALAEDFEGVPQERLNKVVADVTRRLLKEAT